jgi:hypothetical protein
MKKILIIVFILSGIISFTNSCKKTDDSINPLSDIKNLGVGSYLTLKSTTNLNFNFAALASSTVGIVVDQKDGGDPVSQVVIYARKGASYDTTTWKKIKTVPFVAGGTTLSVNGAELAAGLGVSLASFSAGDFYTFYNRVITAGGKQYDVSNSGNNNGSGIVTGSFYNAAFLFTAYITCPFTGNMAGNYKVIADDWQDWSPGDIVQVTDGPGANQINLSKVWPNVAYGNVVNPLLVNVDPATGTAKVPKTTFAAYSPLTSAQGVGSGDVAGYVFSCTGYITLTMQVIYGGSNQGNLRLILQKQ